MAWRGVVGNVQEQSNAVSLAGCRSSGNEAGAG